MNYQQIANKYVHPETGLFSRITTIPIADENLKIHIHLWIPHEKNVALPKKALLPLLGSGGASLDPEQSMMSAMGEALERYSAVKYSSGEYPKKFATWRQLQHSATPHPSQYCLFSEQQHQDPKFPYQSFHEDSPIHWLSGENICNSTSSFVPNALILFPYLRPDKQQEPPLAPALSTGLAFGMSKQRAILNSLYEVIERDAVALAWNWNLPVTRIEPTGLLEDLQKKFGIQDYHQVFAYDATQDVEIPVALVFLVTQKPSGEIYFSLGSACRPNFADALKKAFLEAIVLSVVTPLKLQQIDKSQYRGFEDIRSFQDRTMFYSLFPEHIKPKLQSDILNSHQQRHVTAEDFTMSLQQEWDWCLQKMQQSNKQAIAFDLTVPQLRDDDFHIYRVVVPDLIGLEGAHLYRYRNPQRAIAVCRQKKCNFTENPLPHPLT